LEYFLSSETDFPTKVEEYLAMRRLEPPLPPHGRILKGRRENIHDFDDLGKASNISLKTIFWELIP